MNMKIGIYSNLYKDVDAKAAIALMEILDKKGISYSISTNIETDLVKNAIPLNDLSKSN